MKSKISLNEAIQVGPWRVARKHLLFVIVFGLAIIAFGLIVIQSHVFNSGENEEEEEGDEEGEEEWGEFGERFSGGDWVMIAIMGASGIISLVAVLTCIFVKKNAPRRLSNAAPQNAPIYSVQYNGNNTKPATQQNFSTPQQLPIWSGQIVQQPVRSQPQVDPQQQNQRQQAMRQPILTLPRIIAQGVGNQVAQATVPPRASSNAKRGRAQAPSATAPQLQVENPPPYSP